MSPVGRRLVRTSIAGLVVALVAAPAAGMPRAAPGATDVARHPVLELVDQDFVVGVDDAVHLRYEVNGDRSALDPIVDAILRPPATVPAVVPGESDDPTGEPTTGDPGDGEAGVGAGTDAVGDGPIRSDIDVVVTSYEPILDRARVGSVLAGAPGLAVDGARFDLAEVLVADADPLRIELAVPTALDGDRAGELELPVAGLYPLTVDLVRSDGRRLSRHTTFVVRLPEAGQRPRRAQPLSLAVLAVVPDPGPQPDRLQLLDARTHLVELAQLGEEIAGPLTISVPPVVTSDLDEEFGAQLRAALRGSEILATPSMTFDPTAAVAAGETAAFTRALRDGEDLLVSSFPSTNVRRSAWIWDDPLGRDGAAVLRDLGVPLVVMPAVDYFELDGALPPQFTDPSLLYSVPLADGASMALAVVDPISELLDPARDIGRDTGRTPTDVAVELLATLVAMREQLPDARRAAVLSTARFGVPDADVLAAVERFADQHPAIDLRSLSYLPGSTDVMAVNGQRRQVLLPETTGVDLRPRSARIGITRTLVDSFGSLLPPDDPRHARWHGELDLLLSTGFSDAEADPRIDAVIDEVEVVPRDIDPPDPFTFTLTGQTSEITLRLGNSGSTPLRVLLRPDASKLTFPRELFEVDLAPGTTNVIIPVSALSNGTFPVTIELLAPADQRPIADPIVLTARVNALTGLGQVLTGGALVVLASWWFSHFRGRRRRSAEHSRRTHPSNGGAGSDVASGSVVAP